MIDAFTCLLCSKLCRHNWRKPIHDSRSAVAIAISTEKVCKISITLLSDSPIYLPVPTPLL